ncbi:MAG: type II toxin-antitoxin system ParD family antitoxin [Chakrabartia sp.]
MTQLNVSIPPALKEWVDTRVAEGRYSSASDYMRDLVRRDQAAADEEETIWLRGLIEEGLASGAIHKPAKEVLREIVAERHARRG